MKIKLHQFGKDKLGLIFCCENDTEKALIEFCFKGKDDSRAISYFNPSEFMIETEIKIKE